jgi:hypothetical protein
MILIHKNFSTLTHFVHYRHYFHPRCPHRWRKRGIHATLWLFFDLIQFLRCSKPSLLYIEKDGHSKLHKFIDRFHIFRQGCELRLNQI